MRIELEKKAKQNDPKRFIKTTNITNDGELADKSIYEINQSIIDEEAKCVLKKARMIRLF